MNNLSQEVGKNLVQPTINITKKKLKKYRNRFQKHKNKIDITAKDSKNIMLKIKAFTYTDERLLNMTSKELASELLKVRRQGLENTLFEEASKLLLKLENEYKNAYEDINNFRAEFFIPITYSYGFELDGQTYSVSGLTFKEIADLISLEVESRGKELDKIYKLRLNPSKEQLKVFKEAHEKKLIALRGTSEKGTTLWDTLEKYREKYSKGTKYYINRGQMYEVYRSLTKKDGYKNGPPSPNIDEKEILSRFIEVRKNNLSWTRGGDVEEEQDKFMNASITTATSLIKTLNRLIDILKDENLNKEKIAKEIARVFGNENFDSKVKNEAREIALKELEKELLLKL